MSFEGVNNPNWKGGVSSNNYRYTKRYREKYPEKEPAHKVVYRAIRSGKLTKPKFCQHPRCFETEIFAHHIDYKKPLAVEWFCKKHHSDVHNGKYDSGNKEAHKDQMSFF